MTDEDEALLPAKPDEDPPVHVRAFLIADVRGYTRFTAEHGDEVAAELASAFAALTRAGVEAFDGQLIEVRGDEALAVFLSTRRAIRAALDLQRRYAEHSRDEPELTLGVGIGIDAGEAVPVEGGFRGGALNLAARLCSIAGPGHILATEAVTHLARKVEGCVYVEQPREVFKGLDAPVSFVEIVSESAPPALASSSAVIEPPAEAQQKVPFSDLGERIGALVDQQLQTKLGRWAGEGDSASGSFGSYLGEQIRASLTQSRQMAPDQRPLRTDMSRTLPADPALPPPPGRPEGTTLLIVIVAVTGGVIIALAVIAAIVVIALKAL
jgi:class 3 adenylate cyclase